MIGFILAVIIFVILNLINDRTDDVINNMRKER